MPAVPPLTRNPERLAGLGALGADLGVGAPSGQQPQHRQLPAGQVPRQWLGRLSDIQGACSSTIRRVA